MFVSRLLITGTLVLILTGQSCSISFQTTRQLDGGVFRSDDGGRTWNQAVNAGLTDKGKPIRIDNVDTYSLRFDPVDRRTMYILSRGTGIYKSTDNGANWQKTGLASGTYPAFAIDPTTSAILYAGSGGTIVKSTDGGITWNPIYYESKPDRGIADLTVQPNSTNIILAATSTGDLLRSTDYGNTWNLFSTTVGYSPSRMFYAPDSSSLLFALSSGGLIRSTDNGLTWEPLTPKLAAYPGGETISSLTTIERNSQTLYLATNYGLLKTTDAGSSWSPIQTLVPFASQPIQSVAVDPDNQSVLYVVVGNRLRKSEDGGKNWDAKITIPTGRIITSLILNPDAPSQLFLGTIRPKK